MKRLLLILSFFLLSQTATVQAAGAYGITQESAQNNLRDKDSLKRGAMLFSNYCMACHSVSYIRYNRIARNLGWDDDAIVAEMAYGQSTVVDDVNSRMLPGVAMAVFGTEPPDLSLMTRVKGSDYIYSFLRGYEQDEKGEWDNRYLPGTVMPNVLEGIQRHSSEKEYAEAARDITNFLEYVSEPSKIDRLDLGWKVIAFLLVLLLLTYLLKREYWKDIK